MSGFRGSTRVWQSCLLLALAALLAFLQFGRAAALSPVSEPDYWKLVSDSAETVKKLAGAPESDVQAACKELASRWESVTQVKLDGGQTVAVDSGPLVELLKAAHPDLKATGGLLEQMEAAHKEARGARINQKDAAKLTEILARPEFSWEQAQPNAVLRWFQDLLRKVREWLDSILPHDVVIDLRVPFTIAVFAALLLVLYFGFRDAIGEFAAEASLKEGQVEELLDASGALQRAQQFSQSGDRRSAVRYLYLSALLLLEERGLLRYDRSLTNREYVRSVRSHPDLARILKDVIEVFDRVWYGFEPIDAQTYAHYAKQVESLKEQK